MARVSAASTSLPQAASRASREGEDLSVSSAASWVSSHATLLGRASQALSPRRFDRHRASRGERAERSRSPSPPPRGDARGAATRRADASGLLLVPTRTLRQRRRASSARAALAPGIVRDVPELRESLLRASGRSKRELSPLFALGSLRRASASLAGLGSVSGGRERQRDEGDRVVSVRTRVGVAERADVNSRRAGGDAQAGRHASRAFATVTSRRPRRRMSTSTPCSRLGHDVERGVARG